MSDGLDLSSGLNLTTVRNFGTALLIGALIGIEREKRRSIEARAGMVGLRTFILIALVGAIAGWLVIALSMPWILVVVVSIVAAAVLTGYVLDARTHPESLGMTTETAAVAVCLLGAMTTLGQRDLSVALAVVVTAVLAYKQPLHGLVGQIGWEDIFAGLRLLIATFIVLPLMPDRALDPWGALNPYSLWLLVLLISSLSLVGYVATRWLGAKRGIPLTGMTGGLVSSTAVTLSFARQSRDDGRQATAYALASGMLLAWAIMFGRVIAEVLVVNRAIAADVIAPFAAMGVSAAIPALFYFRRGASTDDRPATVQDVPLTNPFSLTAASQFAVFFATILLLVRFVQMFFPGNGLYVVAALAGLTDVDAITLSMSELARHSDPRPAVNAIVVASLTNTVAKSVIVAALAGPALRVRILAAASLILTAGLLAIVLR